MELEFIVVSRSGALAINTLTVSSAGVLDVVGVAVLARLFQVLQGVHEHSLHLSGRESLALAFLGLLCLGVLDHVGQPGGDSTEETLLLRLAVSVVHLGTSPHTITV